MKYRRILNGEPQFGQGSKDYLQGIDAVGQAIETSLRLFTGEWWEDLNDGLPLWGSLLSYAGANKEKSTVIITKRILGITLNGGKIINSMIDVTNTYNSTTRSFTFKGTAMSVYGPITVSSGG